MTRRRIDAGVPGGVADRVVSLRAEVHVPERRGDRGAAPAGGAHRQRRRSCSSGDPMSWSPATCSTRGSFPSSTSSAAAASRARSRRSTASSSSPCPRCRSCRARRARSSIPGHGRLYDQYDVDRVPRHGDDHPRPRPRSRSTRDDRSTRSRRRSPAKGYAGRYGNAGRRLDDGPVRRGGLPEPREGEAVRARSAAAIVPWSSLAARRSASRRTRNGRAALAREVGPRRRADRPDRLLGVLRHRELALPDGDAGQGRVPPHSRVAGRPAAHQRLGSGRGRARGQPVQVVRRGRHHERAGPPAHHLAGCRHAAHRHRRGHADAALPLLARAASHRRHAHAGRASRARAGSAATGPDGGGSLRVVTSNLRAGYLRKNGVPYSERATVTEHFDIAPLPDGGQLLLVTTIVEDPVYLTGPYVVSPHFKKEPDGSKWDPTPCSSTW